MRAVNRYWHRLGATFLAISILAAPLSVSANGQTVLYRLKLPNGTSAVVYTDGVAQMLSKEGRVVKSVIVKPGPQYDGKNSSGKHFDPQTAIGQLLMQPRQPYAPDRVIVVYRDGVQAPQDVVSIGVPALRSLRTAISKGALACA
jgi:hypothetical protein